MFDWTLNTSLKSLEVLYQNAVLETFPNLPASKPVPEFLFNNALGYRVASVNSKFLQTQRASRHILYQSCIFPQIT